MKLKDALKRIEELERKVAELEARPAQIHHHYHQHQPLIEPQPLYQPGPLWPHSPNVWCAGSSVNIGAGVDRYPGHS